MSICQGKVVYGKFGNESPLYFSIHSKRKEL